MNKSLLMGNQALARGAWEAGAKVVSSYPGTPSTEITEYCAAYPEMYVEWASNEKVALETAIGASYAGARSLCCMKHVGLNVAADPLFTAAYTGVNGGLVIVVADDPGMHSSQDEQDSRNYARAAMVPMLEPSDSAECLYFMKRAYAMSEKYDTPVIIRTTTRIAHARSLALTGERADFAGAAYKKDVMKYVMMPGMARARRLVVETRMGALGSDVCDINVIEMRDKAIGVVCSGIAYQYVREALPEISTLKLGMVYPLNMGIIEEFARQVDALYVIEELSPFIEDQIAARGIRVNGLPASMHIGELSVRGILSHFGRALPKHAEAVCSVPQRPPVLCPGCPHRATYAVLSKMKLRVCGDIGCYTLGALNPLSSMDTCLCMGASISMAHGMKKAGGGNAKTVAVIGDSTFAHTGVNGLISSVYNHGTGVTLILDNATTGMTGHQPNPTTGFSIRKTAAPQIDLVKLCQAIGVKRVKCVDPFDMDALENAINAGIAAGESTVIIAKRPCVLLKRADAKKMRINENCKKCKACMRIGCPAISVLGGAVAIDGALCVGCGLCARVCRFGGVSAL